MFVLRSRHWGPSISKQVQQTMIRVPYICLQWFSREQVHLMYSFMHASINIYGITTTCQALCQLLELVVNLFNNTMRILSLRPVSSSSTSRSAPLSDQPHYLPSQLSLLTRTLLSGSLKYQIFSLITGLWTDPINSYSFPGRFLSISSHETEAYSAHQTFSLSLSLSLQGHFLFPSFVLAFLLLQTCLVTITSLRVTKLLSFLLLVLL